MCPPSCHSLPLSLPPSSLPPSLPPPFFPSLPPSVHFTLSLSLSLSSCCQASVWPLYHQEAVWGLETGWILLQDTLQLRVSGGLSGSFRGPRSKVYSRTGNTIQWVLTILLCTTVGEVLSIQALVKVLTNVTWMGTIHRHSSPHTVIHFSTLWEHNGAISSSTYQGQMFPPQTQGQCEWRKNWWWMVFIQANIKQ